MTDMLPAGAPAPGTYTLDPERTTIRADAKAMFGLLTVHGTFQLQSGQVSIAADPGASSVQASIAAASYASGNAAGTPTSSRPACSTPGASRRSPSSARALAVTVTAGWWPAR